MSKVILITGASSGLGKSIAQYLSEKGFKVYGTSRNPIHEDLNFKMLQLDVRDLNSIQTCIKELLSKEDKIDILINNAGVGITGPLEEIPMEEIKNNFETNLFGPLALIKEVLPYMRSQKSGLIINITSIAGYMGLPFRSVYSSSKSAFEIISESLRMELKQFGIQVTTVAPGDFATDIASRRFHAPVLKNSPYKEVYQNQLNMMNEHVSSGSNPIEIAIAIHDIIENSNPKVHYKVGAFMQKFSIFLKAILPDKWYEKLLMNHYQLK